MTEMGSCGDCGMVTEPSSLEEEPGSESEQRFCSELAGRDNANVDSPGVLDERLAVTLKENTERVSSSYEAGVPVSQDGGSVSEQEREDDVLGAQMSGNKDTSGEASVNENSGGLDTNTVSGDRCLKGDMSLSGNELGHIGGSVNGQGKGEVLDIEKMSQNKELSDGACINEMSGLDENNMSEDPCLKSGVLLNENELGNSFEGSEIAKKLVLLSVSATDNVQKDTGNDNICSGSDVKAFMEAKSGREKCACGSTLQLQASEIDKHTSLKTACSSPCAQYDEKDAESIVTPLEKMNMEAIDGKSDDAPRREVGMHILMVESSDVIDLVGNHGQENEQSVDKIEAPIEKIDSIIDDFKTEICLEGSHAERFSCNSKEDIIKTAGSSTNRELISFEPDQPSGVMDKVSLEKLDTPDDDAVNVVTGDISYRSITEVPRMSDNTEEGNNSAAQFSVFKCPGTVSSNSQSSDASKSGQKSQKRKSIKKRQNRSVPRQCGTTENIFKISRRKRSCLSKLARSSIWGSLDNAEFFQRGSEEAAHQETNEASPKTDTNEASPKTKGSAVGGKRSKKGLGGSKRGPRQRTKASSNPIRLKIRLKKEVDQRGQNMTVLNAADASAPSATLVDDPAYDSNLGGTLTYLKVDLQVAEKSGDNETGKQVQFLEKNSASDEPCSDSSNLDVDPANKDPDGTLGLINSAVDSADARVGHSFNVVGEEKGLHNVFVDPGTSPDSEVINSNPEALAGAGARCQEDLHHAVIATKDCVPPGEVISNKRGKTRAKNSLTDTASNIDTTSGQDIVDKAKHSKKRVNQKKAANSSIHRTTSRALPRSKEFCAEPLSFLRDTTDGVSRDAFTDAGIVENKTDSTMDANPGLSERQSTKVFSNSKKKGHKLGNKLKSGKGREGKSKPSNLGRNRRGTGGRQKKNTNVVFSKSKMEDMGFGKQLSHEPCSQQETDDVEKTLVTNKASVNASKVDVMSNNVVEQYPSPREAWVCCDDCRKWRRIPPFLLKSIAKNRWVCKYNMDKTFADCSIPQEKSNAEINEALGYSDPSCEEDDHVNRHRVRKDPSREYKMIRTNEYLHRSRKTQNIDEIMVCHCKPPQDGQLGCGDGCLNRMLNVECVKGTCPCGDLCSNQQFQRKQWTKLCLLQCGKKGYGLKSRHDVSAGRFLIEYVGEVLDIRAYEERQKEYAEEGRKHFYFMTLNGGEVIDACKKGNLGRFINHSCEPNCRTEKWMVNGEICIGLFAIRDIKKDEELTFDYNYVRVFGAAVKKCYCGSPHCQSYIGGDPLDSDIVIQDDSEEEYFEHVMHHGDEKLGIDSENAVPRCDSFDDLEMQNERNELAKKLHKTSTAEEQVEGTTEKEEFMDRAAAVASPFPRSLNVEDSVFGKLITSQQNNMSQQTDDSMIKTTSSGQKETPLDEPTINDALCSAEASDIFPTVKQLKTSANVSAVKKLEPDALEENRVSVKSRPRVKTSVSARRGKVTSVSNGSKDRVISSKTLILPSKPSKIVQGFPSGRYEAVEEKLNELLDICGGVKKDATKGYLKLLLLTAASGDRVNGEAIQSNRDLSMILDALLKTKSRTVLTDIMNKNGLRMLHNIMKQYRREFNKIPILRKLLKVLEHLQMRGVLTLEHIIGGPPCPGMESFRESMLSLTEHEDKQVHQIARHFRDRCIPRPFRRLACKDKDDARMDFHRSSKFNRFSASEGYQHDHGIRQNEVTDCFKQSTTATPPVHCASQESHSVPYASGSPTNASKTRKRKSRWDQPAQETLKSHYKHEEHLNDHQVVGQNSTRQDEATRIDSGKQKMQDDVPPGFPPSIARDKISSSFFTSADDMMRSNARHQQCPVEAAVGHPQAKFNSRLPVSYGIPLSVLEQFGTPRDGSVDGWVIAPGMPFNPFPPLPPIPCDKKDSFPTSAVNPSTMDQMAGQKDSHDSAFVGGSIPSTTGGSQPCLDGPKNQHNHKRARGFSYDMGRRHFKQQKGNNARFGPPWLRKRNGWGFTGNNSRNGTGGLTTMNGQSSHCPEDVKCCGERASSNFYHHL